MFTDEELKAAKATRDAIIKENISELKSIYMAGEIIMWDEMRTKIQQPQAEQQSVNTVDKCTCPDDQCLLGDHPTCRWRGFTPKTLEESAENSVVKENLDIDEEDKYRVEACRQPLGQTGDYDSWLELVCPDFNLQCYDPNIDEDELQAIADKLNREASQSAEIERLKDVVDALSTHRNAIENAMVEYLKTIEKLTAENERLKEDKCKPYGYTELVKIAEAALNGDVEKAKTYINKFIIKFPVESDLTRPFRSLLNGNTNPSGLGFHDIIES